MYGEGRGVAKDEARAARLFTQACDGGEKDGCEKLALLRERQEQEKERERAWAECQAKDKAGPKFPDAYRECMAYARQFPVHAGRYQQEDGCKQQFWSHCR